MGGEKDFIEWIAQVLVLVVAPAMAWLLYRWHLLDKESAVNAEKMAQVKDRLDGQHGKFSEKLDKIDIELQEMKVSIGRIEADVHHLSNGKPKKKDEV